MQDRGGSRPPGRSNARMEGDERRQAKAGQGVGGDQQLDNSINQQNISINQVLKCPRCDSLNTKFCYYNNYSLLQPRHFCKNCRRYWTKGGALRDVPIGGGCRKNKRTSASSSSTTPSKQRLSDNAASSNSTVIAAAAVHIPTVHRRQNDFSSVSNTSLLQPSAALPETSLSSATTPTSRYYSLHRNNNINSMDADKSSFPFASRPLNQPTLRLADHLGQISANPSLTSLSNPGLNPLAHTSLSLLNLQSRSSSATNHLAALPPSTLASRSNHFSSFGALSLRNGLMGLDFNAADYSQQPSLHPTLLSPAAISEDLNPGRHLNSNPHLPSASTVIASTVPSTVTDTNDILSGFSLALDRFDSTNQDDEQWKSHHEQRINLDNQQEGQLRGQLQAFLPFENQGMEGVMQQLSHEQLTKPGLMPDNCKVKGEDPPVENWPGQEGFIEPSVDANYWNNTSTWPDLSTYAPSTTPLLSHMFSANLNEITKPGEGLKHLFELDWRRA